MGVDQVAATITGPVADTSLRLVAFGGSIAACALHACQSPPFALVLLADLGAELKSYILLNLLFHFFHPNLPFYNSSLCGISLNVIERKYHKSCNLGEKKERGFGQPVAIQIHVHPSLKAITTILILVLALLLESGYPHPVSGKL